MYLKKILSIAFLVLITNGCTDTNATKENINKKIEWLNGDWKGKLYFHHIDKSIFVILHYKKENSIEMEYLEKNCTSKLELSSTKSAILLKEISMIGNCEKINEIRLNPYVNDEMVSENLDALSNINVIYLQYPKDRENKQLLAGWLELQND